MEIKPLDEMGTSQTFHITYDDGSEEEMGVTFAKTVIDNKSSTEIITDYASQENENRKQNAQHENTPKDIYTKQHYLVPHVMHGLDAFDLAEKVLKFRMMIDQPYATAFYVDTRNAIVEISEVWDIPKEVLEKRNNQLLKAEKEK